MSLKMGVSSGIGFDVFAVPIRLLLVPPSHDSIAMQLVVERGSAQVQALRGFATIPARGLESGDDESALVRFNALLQRQSAGLRRFRKLSWDGGFRVWRSLTGELCQIDFALDAEGNECLDCILEFTDVAGPGVGFESGEQ